MRRILALLPFILIAAATNAQVQTSLSEDFNSSFCPSQGPYYPNNWQEKNFIANTDSMAWRCTPVNGKMGTGGMFCTNYYLSAAHLDTAYLVSPPLDIQGYTGTVYMQFDTKTDNFSSAHTLGFMHSNDSNLTNTDSTYPAAALFPAVSAADAAGWVTHQVDITNNKAYPFFYFAFRYTSDASFGNTWFLDNVLLTGTSLNVSGVSKGTIQLNVVGYSSPDQIKLSFRPVESGAYDLALYDMLGRQVYKQTLNVQSGPSTYTIDGLNLRSGMYFIKLGNTDYYSTVKTMVQ